MADWPHRRMQIQLRYLALAALFAVLTAVGAQIRIPLFPVPFTLQTFFVILSGSLLGPVWGAAGMGLYILLGLIGLPVFAGPAGLAVVAGPTFGYLLGFPVCAFWIGARLKKKDLGEQTRTAVFLIQLEGQIWIFLLGVIYLWMASHVFLANELTVKGALAVGFFPFIPGALIKTLAATWFVFQIRKRLIHGGIWPI